MIVGLRTKGEFAVAVVLILGLRAVVRGGVNLSGRELGRVVFLIVGRPAGGERVMVLILGLRAVVRGGVNLSGRKLEQVVVLSLGRRGGGWSEKKGQYRRRARAHTEVRACGIGEGHERTPGCELAR